jgi:hypothetical protein
MDVEARVARWYISQTKIPIWVNFGGSCSWYILWPFCQFPSHLVYFMANGIIYPILVYIFPSWYVEPRKIWQPWWKPADG